MDRMICSGGFFDFVRDIIKTYNKEQKERNEEFQDRVLWEFWLHRVHNMDYSEFLQKTKNRDSETEYVPKETLGKIVKDSAEMMKSFCPD